MANTTITPNMNLPAPTPGEDPGPDWATNNNACLYAIDSHNHSPGQGVPITPDGLDISSDLDMQSNDLTNAQSVGMISLLAALTSLLQSLQVVGVDLYFIDGNGNAVRITQSGSVTGSTGTITGLPSGTASASFAAGTFTFQSATNTPATINCGPVVSGAVVANAKTVTIGASSSQPANYALTWPLAVSAGVFKSDVSGNMSIVPLGTVVSSTVGVVTTLPSSSFKSITSISLAAGTWLVSGAISFNQSSPYSGLLFNALIGDTVDSDSGAVDSKSSILVQLTTAVVRAMDVCIPGFVITVVSTTTYYLTAFTNVANTDAGGTVTAVRIA